MPLFTRRIPYDRRRLVERARALARTRRWRAALRLYRQVLAAEPGCIEIHGEVAPLLARARRQAEAWASFGLAIEGYAAIGDGNASMALREEAVRSLPLCAEACREVAEAERARGRKRDAIRVLVDGATRLTKRRRRGEAILLLRAAREIERWHPATVLMLARLVARDGFPGEALFLLDHLDDRVTGNEQRRARALAFRTEPSARHAWRWWRAGRSNGAGVKRRRAA